MKKKEQASEVRIDKFLWSVRVYKTRSQATEACKKGRVSVNGMEAKASRNVRVDDLIEVKKNPITYQYRIIQLLQRRVGAKLVPEYVENITPEEELAKLENINKYNFVVRNRGEGRPTKKERRDIDKMLW